MNLINNILKSHKKPDYLLFHELSLPAQWFIPIAKRLYQQGIALIAGVDYINGKRSTVSNQVWASLDHDTFGFRSYLIYSQDKQQPALHEERELTRYAGLRLAQKNKWKKPPIIQHGNINLAILICSELTNISYRASLRGKIDVLFVPEWNKDLNAFGIIVESASNDIHAYIAQSNNLQYGDSRIRGPYKDSWKRDIVRLKGGSTDYFVIGEIDVNSLRQFQSNHRSPDGPFKPVPDGFQSDMDSKRRTLPK